MLGEKFRGATKEVREVDEKTELKVLDKPEKVWRGRGCILKLLDF